MTLWDFQKVMRHSLAIALAELRRRLPGRRTAELTIDTLVQTRNTVAAALKGRTSNLEEIRLRAFERTLERLGWPNKALAADLNALYLKHRYDDIELYPDVMPCLDRLRTEYVLGLLSNGNGYLDRCGLPGRFSFVVLAQDVGAEKPDAAMFRAACRQAGCAPGQLVHVGDSLGSDVAGANGAGVVSVRLHRQRHVNDSGIVSDYEVNSLADVVGILARRTK